MAEFTAKDVQALRRATGAGMLDAKRALEATEGDPEAAAQWLRVQGLAKAVNRQGRENSEGTVALVLQDNIAAALELRCETDFVAKSAEFLGAAERLAKVLLLSGEDALANEQPSLDELKIRLGENISIGKTARLESPPDGVLGVYLHSQNGRGVNGVIVQLRGGNPELAHDIAVHIAFARPRYLSRADVPEDEIAAERGTLTAMARQEGKSEAALEKVVDGRMRGWFKERCLLEQDYVRDEKRTIADLLGTAEVVTFAQVAIGG